MNAWAVGSTGTKTGATIVSRDKVTEEGGVKRRFRLRRMVGGDRDGDGDGEEAAHDVLEEADMSAVIACCL